ncbi:MAG: hypothetical protein IT204_13630 [Fimbriimonadaceae bacterium]|nr:hypothetical protein [Fimbriimonadaceae bacterium]
MRLIKCCGLLLLLAGCSTPKQLSGLRAEVLAPPQVAVGQIARLQLLVQNTGQQPIKVTDLDFSAALLQGLTLVQVSPPAVSEAKLRDYLVETINLEVPAGGEAYVTIDLLGAVEGRYAGDLDVSLSNFHFVTVKVPTITVGNPPPATEPAPASSAPSDETPPAEPPAGSAGEPSPTTAAGDATPSAAWPAPLSGRAADSPPDPAPATADRPAPGP